MTGSIPVRRGAGLTAVVILTWWVGMTWGVPMVIRGAHAGWIPVLGRLMAGRDAQPVEGYLAQWQPIGRGLVVVGSTAAVLLLVSYLLRRIVRVRHLDDGAGPAPATGWQFLLVAAWMGLLTGLGEAGYYVSRVFYQGKETPNVFGISQHAVWMSPLANLLVFVAAGVVLLIGRRASGGRLDGRTGMIALAWLSLFALVMTTGRLQWVAAAILTLGIAMQVGRAIQPGGHDVAVLARQSIGWMLAAVIGLGVAVPVLETVRERRQLAVAPAAAPDAPNVLFIVLDTERAASTSLHGETRPTTPFLDRLAREGAWFERAITPAGWTLPSHAAMFTGRPTHELGVNWTTPLGTTHPTLAEVLGRRGYATAGFVANDKYLSDLFGLGRGFGRWQDQTIMPGTVIIHSRLARTLVGHVRRWRGQYQILRRKTADAVNTEFLGWLDRREPRPFFAFLNYFDPHIPYLPPTPWNLRFSTIQPLYWIDDNRGDSTYTATERADLEIAYLSSIAYLDNRLEALFGSLRERRLLENTLVVITSDHGEEFGTHGPLTHGFDLTMPLIHVPLVVIYPGTVPAGTRIAAPVEVRHLAATVLGLTGEMDERLGGESLAPYWMPGADSPRGGTAFSVDGGVASLVTDSFQVIQGRGRADRLFNHRLDPLGLHDLADDPRHADIMVELQQAIRARLAANP